MLRNPGLMASVIAPGQVAVVTGAASGIGLALSERFCREGMRVVMADAEEPALAEAADLLASRGAEVLPVPTDVARPEQVDRLRDRVLEAFGGVHVLCNNAGVGGQLKPPWEVSQADWDWVLGVNLWGVINGIRSFVPTLLRQEAAHVVNTASIAGLIATAQGAYSVSKHGVVALSEDLYLWLQQLGPQVGVSVLCPGFVRTRIMDADRNRPAGPAEVDPDTAAVWERLRQLVDAGMEPAHVADHVVAAVRSGRFYVLTHPEWGELVSNRTEQVLRGSPPNPPM
jgi:NAD(P)-dependent dehydrogenase (short-subunit alcohol dehydrogenase family)